MSIDLYALMTQHETSRNRNAGKPINDDEMPCVVCGNPMKEVSAMYVHVHDGGRLIVSEEEAQKMGGAGDMLFSPIGSSCIRRHPEIKPYARKMCRQGVSDEPIDTGRD